jgi:hypothetical protein
MGEAAYCINIINIYALSMSCMGGQPVHIENTGIYLINKCLLEIARAL